MISFKNCRYEKIDPQNSPENVLSDEFCH